MDQIVENISKTNGKFLKPIREPDFDQHKHWLCLSNSGVTRVDSHASDHIRCETVRNYMDAIVKQPTFQIGTTKCYIPVSYDDDWGGMDGVLCFSRRHNQSCPLMPDLYQMMGYGSLVRTIHDQLTFDAKASKVCFHGATTGDTNPTNNDRVKACLWSLSNRDISNYHITNIVQMSQSALENHVGGNTFQAIHRPFKGIPESVIFQLNYKYLASIDGNTAAWDRPVWIMRTNSLMFRYPSKYDLWYSELAKDGVHHVDVDEHSIRNKVEFFNNNPREAHIILGHAKQFNKTVCVGQADVAYTRHLLQNAIDAI